MRKRRISRLPDYFMTSRSEPLSVFLRVHKAADHRPRRAWVGIEERKPGQEQSIRVASEISEILCDHKCLVEILDCDFVAFDNLPEHLRPGQRRIIQAINQGLPLRQRDRGCL